MHVAYLSEELRAKAILKAILNEPTGPIIGFMSPAHFTARKAMLQRFSFANFSKACYPSSKCLTLSKKSQPASSPWKNSLRTKPLAST